MKKHIIFLVSVILIMLGTLVYSGTGIESYTDTTTLKNAIQVKLVDDLIELFATTAALVAGSGVMVSADDADVGYLDGKLLAGDGIAFVVNNPGASETMTISASGQLANVTIGTGLVLDSTILKTKDIRQVLTKTDDYTLTISDLGKSIRLNSADDKTLTLPSVGASEDGARVTFIKQGAGRMTMLAVDSDTIDDSGAAGTIYTTTSWATITLEYVHGMTRWVIIAANGTFTTT